MERLQKAIAQAGICSRRKAEELITAGKVRVNGKTVTELGTRVSGSDEIMVNGRRLEREPKMYFVLNKPKGCVCTVSDDKGRVTVMDYVPNDVRLFPVGRLDYDTTGVLLLTNDGDFANKMTHPKFHLPKTYEVSIDGMLSDDDLKKIRKGFSWQDYTFAPARVYVKNTDKARKRMQLDLTIYEGQNHQVKNMMEALGCSVRRLNRSKFGFVEAGELKQGQYRRLKPFDVRKLVAMSEGSGETGQN